MPMTAADIRLGSGSRDERYVEIELAGACLPHGRERRQALP